MTMLPVRDVSLFVKIMGQGDPVVLMHGGPGLDYTTLSSLEPLADRFTLIFYDHRANGRSGGETSSMTWDNLTADAEALRYSLGFERWAVLGHSFGGQVALEYALRYPDRVSRLLLLDTCGELWWYAEGAASMLKKRGYSDATAAAARRFFNGEMRPDEASRLVMKFMRAYFYRFRLRDLPHALISGSRIKMRPEAMVQGFGTLMKEWSVMDRLGEIAIPTLVLGGRFDFIFPPEHQAILADRILDSRLEIIESAGHLAHSERAGEVIEIVENFLYCRDRGQGFGRHAGRERFPSPTRRTLEPSALAM